MNKNLQVHFIKSSLKTVNFSESFLGVRKLLRGESVTYSLAIELKLNKK
jgi:hypothetical protein